MKLLIAILAACAATLALPSGLAHAQSTSNPIPGVDIIVKKNPGGTPIKVGDCRSGGGQVLKQGTEWVCSGAAKPGTGSSGAKKSRMSANEAAASGALK